VLAKLDVHSRAQAVAFAYEHNLVPRRTEASRRRGWAGSDASSLLSSLLAVEKGLFLGGSVKLSAVVATAVATSLAVVTTDMQHDLRQAFGSASTRTRSAPKLERGSSFSAQPVLSEVRALAIAGRVTHNVGAAPRPAPGGRVDRAAPTAIHVSSAQADPSVVLPAGESNANASAEPVPADAGRGRRSASPDPVGPSAPEGGRATTPARGAEPVRGDRPQAARVGRADVSARPPATQPAGSQAAVEQAAAGPAASSSSDPPGLSGDPPGLTSDPPGLSGDPPGLTSDPPGLSGSDPPGLSGSDPPGLSGSDPPGLSGRDPPGLSGDPPGPLGEPPPGQNDNRLPKPGASRTDDSSELGAAPDSGAAGSDLAVAARIRAENENPDHEDGRPPLQAPRVP
jgi:hypothetical protein